MHITLPPGLSALAAMPSVSAPDTAIYNATHGRVVRDIPEMYVLAHDALRHIAYGERA